MVSDRNRTFFKEKDIIELENNVESEKKSMVKSYWIYAIAIVFSNLACNNNEKNKYVLEYGHCYQFFINNEGILKIDITFLDTENEGNEISIYDSNGILIGVQSIDNSLNCFGVDNWQNDTIVISVCDYVSDRYMNLLNNEQLDFLKPVTKYKLKFVQGTLPNSKLKTIYKEFDNFYIDKIKHNISFENKNINIGT